MPQETKPTITVGIAAYNAEKNIGSLLQSMLAQESINFTLRKIIVHCDDCTDNTIEVIQSIKSEKIQIIDNKERKGFAGSVLAILDESLDQELIILLNDDIVINDNSFIDKLIKPFQGDLSIGMVCANRDCLEPVNFVDKVGESVHRIWKNVKDLIGSDNHPHTVDGKAMAISKKLAEVLLSKRNNVDKLGTLDIFIYLSCVTNKMVYKFVSEAVVYFRNPTTWKDYFEWHLRNYAQYRIMELSFGSKVRELYYRPASYYRKSLIKEFFKSPINSVLIFFQAFHLRALEKKYANNFTATWRSVESTKTIN